MAAIHRHTRNADGSCVRNPLKSLRETSIEGKRIFWIFLERGRDVLASGCIYLFQRGEGRQCDVMRKIKMYNGLYGKSKKLGGRQRAALPSVGVS